MITQDQHEAAELHAHYAEQDRLKNPVPDDNAVTAVRNLHEAIVEKSHENAGAFNWNEVERHYYVINEMVREMIQIAQDTGTGYAYRKRAAEIKNER